MADWHKGVTEGAFFVAGLGLIRICKLFFFDGWASKIRFRWPSTRALVEDGLYFVGMGIFVEIFSAFGWRAFHGALLSALAILLVVLIGLTVMRRFKWTKHLNATTRR